MGDTYVAVDGTWRKVAEQFVAHGSIWRASPESLVAVSSTWRSGFSGVPECTLSASALSSSPYSRLTYTYLVTGVWTKLEIIRIGPGASTSTVMKTYGPSTGVQTVSETSVLVTGMVPSSTYTIQVKAYDSVNKPTVIGTKNVVMSAPPLAKNWRARNPINHYQGGLDWDSSTDVGDWQSVNDSLGTSWNHGGNLPYIYYTSGLSPSTRYYVRTRSYVNGVYGAWSPQQSWATTAAPYAKGQFDLWPSWADTYQTGESGGQSAKWQNNDRSTRYHGNGDYWGSSRGVQKCCFFYDGNNATFAQMRNAFANGATCTRAWLYVVRANVDAGNGGAVPVQIALHNTAHPGAPGNVSGNHGGVALGKGAGGWSEIPAHWARLIIEQPHPYTGFMIGDSNDRNHYMAIDKGASVGAVKFEIA